MHIFMHLKSNLSRKVKFFYWFPKETFVFRVHIYMHPRTDQGKFDMRGKTN